MRYLLICLIVFFISCGNERELQLPQIDKAEITEIQDVSAAYLFYDETQPDSVLLNRKNLISTTNWLVNVDKRLTLKQAIPHIKFLQSKKKSSSHKNENAKNYFTCHDLSINNLGFLEFTDIVYHTDYTYENDTIDRTSNSDSIENLLLFPNTEVLKQLGTQISRYHSQINFDTNDNIVISGFYPLPFLQKLSTKELIHYLKENDTMDCSFTLSFKNNISVNDYMNYKLSIDTLKFRNIRISNHEFLHY